MIRRINFSLSLSTVLLLFGLTKSAAQTTYNDVLVIINSNSTISEQVGTYFVSARAIPAVNICRISVSTEEVIDSTEFNSLRTQVESYITSKSLTNQINYIVTTKGVPLAVNRGNTFSTSSPSSSVESELALILGPYANNIGKTGIVYSPYYYQNAHFSHSTYGVYLVTRLDAYSFDQITAMIDKAAQPVVLSSSMKFVLDQDPDWNSSLPGLNNNMASAQSILVGKGLNTQLDQTTTYLTGKSNVVGYTSWGSNDHYASLYTANAKPQNTWSAGAIAETYVSTSGRTFTQPVTYGQSLVADLVAEGITGAKGYVYEPFSYSMAVVSVLFDRYTNRYNLAESFYMASRSLSWMDEVVGDPKASVIVPSQILPIQLAQFTAEISGLTAELKWSTVSETNNYGFEIQRKAEGDAGFTSLPGVFIPGHGTTLAPQNYSYTDATAPAGTVYYRLKQIDLDGTVDYFGPVKVVNNASVDHNRTGKVVLTQNFPNPFNPTTTIQFVLPKPDRVTLKVYNSIGQEVATLVDGTIGEGVHAATFSASTLASGVYIYQLKTGNFTSTQKMLLVK